MERLTKAADAIGEVLDEAMGKLAEKVYKFCSLLVTQVSSTENITRLKLVLLCFGKVHAITHNN